MNNNTQAEIESSAPQQQPQVDQRVFFGLLEQVGTKGRYQYLLLFFLCVANYANGALTFVNPYLFYQDPYVCQEQFPGQTCFNHVCNLDPKERLGFIPQASMTTLGNQFGDYRCPNQKLKIDEIQTMIYIGKIVGTFILALLGDILGRKVLFASNFILGAAALIVVNFSHSLIMAGIFLLLATIGVTNVFYMSFSFAVQQMAEENRGKYSVLIQAMYGAGLMFNAVWYYAFADWRMVFWIGYVIPVTIAAVGVAVFLRDSPVYLVMRNSADKAYNQFMFIAKINGVQNPELSVEQIEQIKENYSKSLEAEQKNRRKFTVIDLFKYPSIRKITLLIAFVKVATILMFYTPGLMLDRFKLNIYLNGIALGISTMLTYPLCFFIVPKTSRRLAAYIGFGVSGLCSLVTLFVWDQNPSAETPSLGRNIGILVLIFIFRFGINIESVFYFIYCNQLYPTPVRILGPGLIALLGSAAVTVLPQMIDGCINGGFPIMYIFMATAVMGIVASKFLPETLGKIPSEVIQELSGNNTSQKEEGLEGSLLEKD